MTVDSPSSAPREGRDRFLTLPNLLSLSRIALVLPFVLVMLSELPHARWWAAGVMGLAALTDRLDGALARRWGRSTRWGHFLDPLADKVAVGAVVVTLLVLDAIPVWFVVLALGRDAAILLTGVWLKARKGILLPPNRTGKWAVGIVALALGLLVLDAGEPLTGIVLAVAAALLAASLALYTARFVRILRGSVPSEALMDSPSALRTPQSEVHTL